LACPTNSEKSEGRSVISNAASGLANTSDTSRSGIAVKDGVIPPAPTRQNWRALRQDFRKNFPCKKPKPGLELGYTGASAISDKCIITPPMQLDPVK
jgi:hypothetical protein